MSEKEFSLEQSEELIAGLKSGKASEFEQLRSALNLLAHVPEVSPVSMPPVLPSTISRPVPLVPIKSPKPRRTIVTSIAAIGLFASGSLAAAAVTGIGPAIIVNAGHSAAKFVKSVVGGVGIVVTGGSSDTSQNQASAPLIPSVTTTIAPTAPSISNSNEDSNQNESDHSSFVLPLVSNLIPPLTVPVITNSNSSDDGSETPNAQETQQSTPRVEKTQQPSEDQNQSESNPTENSTPEATRTPTAEPTSEPTSEPSADSGSQPSAGISILPTDEASSTPSAEPSSSPTESPDETSN